MAPKELTSQVTIYDLDHHGVRHPVVSPSDPLAILIESAVDGLYQALGAEEREVHHDFPHYFCTRIVGMAQLIVRPRGPVGHVKNFLADQVPHRKAVECVVAQKGAAGPDWIHLLALLLTLSISLHVAADGVDWNEVGWRW